jgi:hypothetical protein
MAWSNSFTISDPSTITPGATLEIPLAFSGDLTGSTGTLRLDQTSSFSGTVAGLSGQDTLDLRNLNFASIHQPVFSGTPSHTHRQRRKPYRKHRTAG